MNSSETRRQFLQASAATAITAGIAVTTHAASPTSHLASEPHREARLFEVSLAQWSLHRAFRSKKLDNLDFAATTKKEFGITAIEYVNQFFKDKAKDQKYLAEMKKRCDDNGVKSLLIMCDDEGRLGDPNEKRRMKAVEKHFKWVDAAKFLGCHSIRVNAASGGSYKEQVKLAADGLAKLSEFAGKKGLNVIVENHGGLSSNGKWLSEVIKTVGKDNCGTLPDFGNFNIGRGEKYDRYKGVTELMPFAKAVSAKSNDFNDRGDEVHTDFYKMMEIVLKAGYKGYVGIEFEGGKVGEFEGVRLTRNLLNRVNDKLAEKMKKG